MKKILAFLFAMCLMVSMAACGGSSEKATLAVDEIAEEEYKGELSGCSFSHSNADMSISSDIAASDLIVTVKGGRITFDNESVCNAKGVIGGVETPDSPERKIIISGTLPMEQKGADKVSAEGDIAMKGEAVSFYFEDGKFVEWEQRDIKEGSAYNCTVSIEMKDGVPVADIMFQGKNKDNVRSCTLPLKLKDDVAK